jgi:hypothetical protein
MKTFVALLLFAVLLLGCAAQNNANQGNQGTPQAGGHGQAPPPQDNLTNPSPPEQNNPTQPNPQGPAAPEQKTEYLLSGAIMQYSLETRYEVHFSPSDIRRFDNITKAYAMQFEVADVRGGMGSNKPLADASKAVLKLRGPNGELVLKPGTITEAEYEALPRSAAWPSVPDFADPMSSQFYFTEDEKLMPAGVYVLTVDVEGDGEVDGQAEITVPGARITNPTFGSVESTQGFDVKWTQAGKPKDFLYTYSQVSGKAGGANLGTKEVSVGADGAVSIPVKPSDFYESDVEIEPGMYMLELQMDGGAPIWNEDAQDYTYGRSQKKVVPYLMNVKEVYFVKFKVGEFCHCDDFFLPSACTITELQGDALC